MMLRWLFVSFLALTVADVGTAVAAWRGPLGRRVRVMTWLDARSASYLAWAWNADFGRGSGPGLITSYIGTPTGFGTGYRGRLLAG